MTKVPGNAGFYNQHIIGRPRTVILLLFIIFSCLGFQIKNFKLDASADSLILEHDKDLAYFRTVSDRYGTGDYLLMTYSSPDDIFSVKNLARIKQLRNELQQVDRIASVVTIFDVPLLSNPPVPLTDIADNIKTLESADADMAMARKEIANSPIYQDMLVSRDMHTTAFQINLTGDSQLDALFKRRNSLVAKKHTGGLSHAEAAELETVYVEYDNLQARADREKHEIINKIRKIISRQPAGSTQFLGGVPMIADDMITFIRNDIKIFGIGMLCFLIITLWVIFRQVRWVTLPMLCCTFSTIIMTGLVSLLGWRVTVISSNFISLQLVITMSITIHLMVRYNELLYEKPEAGQQELVTSTVTSMFKPCVYTTLTTIAGFASLLACDILPVINFGWMMTIGLIVSLAVTFLLFPAGLMLLDKTQHGSNDNSSARITSFFAGITRQHGKAIYIATLSVSLIIMLGISRLTVENSFIDYFRSSTEIYKGMKLIDNKLGGTTPLDLIIDFTPPAGQQEDTAVTDTPAADTPAADNNTTGASDEFDEFDEFDDANTAKDAAIYWYTPDKLNLIKNIHTLLDQFEEIGKVLSLDTVMQVIKQLNDGKNFDHLTLTLLLNELPEKIKQQVVHPYISVEENQARFTMRIKDSMKSLKRDNLLKRIRAEVINRFHLQPEQVHLAGVMILYNNMLQSLVHSQIDTIGYTIIALMVMFLILFRSFKLSLIALFPNLVSALSVLGVMGLFSIPLDMMTITIVSISIGIAVDDTVHYIHRFKHEFKLDRDYLKTMDRCHNSIGNAMFYTSITIVIGFSILALSNFIPSVLFGLLTGLAMVMALIASLTLLPRLIILLKPFD